MSTYSESRATEKTERFEVSEGWLRRHTTPRGGWTRHQLAQIGVCWPPPHGWLQRAVGLMITLDQRVAFETAGKDGRQPRLLDS